MYTHSWDYSTEELYQVVDGQTDYSMISITRLSPRDQSILVEWKIDTFVDLQSFQLHLNYWNKNDPTSSIVLKIDTRQTQVIIPHLLNGVDYEFYVSIVHVEKNEVVAKSKSRLAVVGHVPGNVINYVHPDDYTFGFSGRSTASPSIVELPNSRLLVSHDMYWGLGGQNLSFIFYSDDRGVTWHFLCNLYPCFWGKLFMHRGDLYMLATSTEYGELLIGKSTDGGKSWSPPTVILSAGSREKGGPHKAPMPIVPYNGRLWTAIEHGSWEIGGLHSGVISVDIEADLLDANQWTVTPYLVYDRTWPGVIKGGIAPKYLEGNVVISPNGEMFNLLRYFTKGGTPNYGKAIMLKVDYQQPAAPLQFYKAIDFIGNNTKFTINYDNVTHKYWSIVNRVTTSNIDQRNVVTLVVSDDLEHWQLVIDLMNYENNGWSEDNTKVGLQYTDWIISGDDLLYTTRTAINHAYNFHNANHITFHYVNNFRNLLLFRS